MPWCTVPSCRCRGAACVQRYCNCADCDPILPVDGFDHNSTPASSISFVLASMPSTTRTAFHSSIFLTPSIAIFVFPGDNNAATSRQDELVSRPKAPRVLGRGRRSAERLLAHNLVKWSRTQRRPVTIVGALVGWSSLSLKLDQTAIALWCPTIPNCTIPASVAHLQRCDGIEGQLSVAQLRVCGSFPNPSQQGCVAAADRNRGQRQNNVAAPARGRRQRSTAHRGAGVRHRMNLRCRKHEWGGPLFKQ